MLGQKMQDALNKQINAEMHSAYLYLSMSAHFQSKNLTGFAVWMKVQAKEETGHAMKMYDYVHDRGGRVKLTAIDAPPVEWESPLAIFEAAHGHEQKITGMIHKLVDLAASEGDHATNNFLQWFVKEQVEEEANADAIVQKLKMMKDFPGGIFIMDKELSARGASL